MSRLAITLMVALLVAALAGCDQPKMEN